MSRAAQVLLIAGGAVIMVFGILLLIVWHQRIVELTGADRLISGLAWRVAEAAVLYGGSWLAVRGWNGRARKAD